MHIKRKHEDKVCSSCSYKAKDLASLKEHANSEHGGIIYPCKLCDKNLVSMEGLRRHEQQYHIEGNAEKGNFKCSHCEYVGKTNHRVLQHQRTVHEGLEKNAL